MLAKNSFVLGEASLYLNQSSSRQKRCRDVSPHSSLRLPWASQWESAVALESDDPRCCIFSRSAKNYLASRSCPAPSRLCYPLVSSGLCRPMVLSRESISSVYAIVIPVRPLFGATSSFTQSTGIHSDTVIGTALRRACGASCIRLCRS